MANGPVALSSSTIVLAWSRHFCLLGSMPEGKNGLDSLGFQANMKGRLWKFAMVCMFPSRSQRRQALYRVFVAQSDGGFAIFSNAQAAAAGAVARSQALPMEQGRLTRLTVPQHLCRCSTQALRNKSISSLVAPLMSTFAAMLGHCTRILNIP